MSVIALAVKSMQTKHPFTCCLLWRCHLMLGTLSLLTTLLICYASVGAALLLLSLWTSLPSMCMQYLAVTRHFLLIGPTCMLKMSSSMQGFPLSSPLTEVLSSRVHSTGLELCAWLSSRTKSHLSTVLSHMLPLSQGMHYHVYNHGVYACSVSSSHN